MNINISKVSDNGSVTEHFPDTFLLERLKQVKQDFNLTMSELASVAGYNRQVIYRVMKGDLRCNLQALYNISHRFGLPMTFWFPDVSGIELVLRPPVSKCVHSEQAPLTQKAIKKIVALSAVDKARLCKFLDSDGAVETVFELAALLSECSESKAETLLKAMRSIVIKPVPAQ